MRRQNYLVRYNCAEVYNERVIEAPIDAPEAKIIDWVKDYEEDCHHAELEKTSLPPDLQLEYAADGSLVTRRD